ncbi:Hypothetical protein LUCI_4325 [Lucifera butyrica]|uniref:HTH merR-type domain-containing protein n=1 Tax=Lucifera butyrica TaxID=1351585 RepID=A0A498RCP6_9FIRM|nr:MerR family transcriptional regulator [Lucifera butyrica]VBB09039.1 Hypothetical protein LUCI_4325 [Lucifera butyrica]
MLIRALSDKTGASIRSIRHYEAKGLLVSRRLENGYRDYDEKAIVKVKTIQLYLGLGLTTENIAQIIDCPAGAQYDRPVCKEAYKLYKDKLEVITKQIETLYSVQQQLQKRIKEFEQHL